MKSDAITQDISLKQWNLRLDHLFVLISGICLITVFYMNGTFKSITSFKPKTNNVAGGGFTNGSRATTAVSNVVTQALAFEALLNTTQQSTLQQTYTTTLARKWSNLPCGASCRNGIEFGSLTSAQLTAALAVIQAALGTTADNGYDEFMQIRLAEEILNTSGGGSGYDTTLRWICFLNTPSTTGAWMLQFGGHHYAANIAFNNGHVIGATPFFMGLEPSSFTLNGTTYAPLTDEHDAFTALFSSLTSTELTSAKLTSTFTDCVMVPGETNGGTGTFPAKAGLLCSALNSTQKNLVTAVMQHYVGDMDSVMAAAIMAVYTSQIDSTYIAYTGSGTSGDASTFLNAATNYVRIDGPKVWIELACQNGVVFPSQIHYHTVWRDHSHDYGVDLTGAPVDTTSLTTAGINQVETINTIAIYPNPTTGSITLSPKSAFKDVSITLTNTIGETTTIATHYNGTRFNYDVSKLSAGVYIINIKQAGSMSSAKFIKQ